MTRFSQLTGTVALALALLMMVGGTIDGSVSAKGKSKAPSVLVEEHKEACMDSGGSFDSVSINGYTMSRCTSDMGWEEICDHSSGQSECDTWQPHTRQAPKIALFHDLVEVQFER